MIQPFSRPAVNRVVLAALALLALLAACGGHDDNQGPGTDLSFKARAAAFAASSAQASLNANITSQLSATERLEVQHRSREWAVDSLFRSPSTSNGVTVPPLHFSLAFAVEAAAGGATLQEWRMAFQPVSSPGVRAELQRGLQRTVTAGERTVLGTGFFDAVTLADHPGALASLQLRGLTADEQALSPLLRVSLHDQATAAWVLPQSETFNATWVTPSGGSLDMSMLRFKGATRTVAGPGWSGQALDLGGGHWLLKLEPTADLSTWTRSALGNALEAAALALDQTGAAVETTWEVPQAAAQGSAEFADRRGLALAQNEVLADFRYLDGGGTYLRFAIEPRATLGLSSAGLGYGGSQQVNFVYSPRNINAPGFGSNTSSGVFTNVSPLSTCPTARVQLRPFYLAVLQPSGNTAMLARLVNFSGRACFNVLFTGAPTPG
jgi:hypothetical protein